MHYQTLGELARDIRKGDYMKYTHPLMKTASQVTQGETFYGGPASSPRVVHQYFPGRKSYYVPEDAMSYEDVQELEGNLPEERRGDPYPVSL